MAITVPVGAGAGSLQVSTLSPFLASGLPLTRTSGPMAINVPRLSGGFWKGPPVGRCGGRLVATLPWTAAGRPSIRTSVLQPLEDPAVEREWRRGRDRSAGRRNHDDVGVGTDHLDHRASPRAYPSRPPSLIRAGRRRRAWSDPSAGSGDAATPRSRVSGARSRPVRTTAGTGAVTTRSRDVRAVSPSACQRSGTPDRPIASVTGPRARRCSGQPVRRDDRLAGHRTKNAAEQPELLVDAGGPSSHQVTEVVPPLRRRTAHHRPFSSRASDQRPADPSDGFS